MSTGTEVDTTATAPASTEQQGYTPTLDPNAGVGMGAAATASTLVAPTQPLVAPIVNPVDPVEKTAVPAGAGAVEGEGPSPSAIVSALSDVGINLSALSALSNMISQHNATAGGATATDLLTTLASAVAPAAAAAVAQGQSGSSSSSDRKRKYEADEESADGKRKKCFRCGGSGHISPDCTSAQTAGDPSDSGVVCFKCGGKGHFARHCPNLKHDVCFNCGMMGHHSQDCPTGPSGKQGFAFANQNLGYGMTGYGMMGGGAAYGMENAFANTANYGTYDPYGMGAAGGQQMSGAGYQRSGYGGDGAVGGMGGYGRGGYDMGGAPGGRSGSCWRCGESGHMARSCPYSQGMPPDACYRCGQTGHMSRECPSQPATTPSGRPIEACFRCGETGHYIRDCNKNGAIANKQACFKCGQLGHQSRYCSGPDVRTCFFCKQTGHVAKDCKLQSGDRH